MNGLASHFRNLLVSKDESTLQLLEVGENIKEKYKTQSAQNDLAFLIGGLEILSNYDVQFKMSKNKRLIYDYSADQRTKNKFENNEILKTLDTNKLPKYIQSNQNLFNDWLEK